MSPHCPFHVFLPVEYSDRKHKKMSFVIFPRPLKCSAFITCLLSNAGQKLAQSYVSLGINLNSLICLSLSACYQAQLPYCVILTIKRMLFS